MLEFTSTSANMTQAATPPEVRLLSAVVALALRDLTKRPVLVTRKKPRDPKYRLTSDALSACRFLFTKHSDGYFEMLNIDPGSFRSNLIRLMDDRQERKIGEFEPMDRRVMRHNHQLWEELVSIYGDAVFIPLPEKDDDYSEGNN
jgi:hypothetical protein